MCLYLLLKDQHQPGLTKMNGNKKEPVLTEGSTMESYRHQEKGRNGRSALILFIVCSHSVTMVYQTRFLPFSPQNRGQVCGTLMLLAADKTLLPCGSRPDGGVNH